MSFEEVMAKLKDAVAAVSADYRSQRYGMDDTNRPNSTLKPGKLLKTITGGTISISTGASGPSSQIVPSASRPSLDFDLPYRRGAPDAN